MLFVMNSTAHKKYEIIFFDQLMCFVTIQDGHRYNTCTRNGKCLVAKKVDAQKYTKAIQPLILYGFSFYSVKHYYYV